MTLEEVWALAEQDNVEAILLLANYYAEDENKDLDKSVGLLQRAAELGSSDAMMKLYPYYENGDVVEVDHNRCFELASKAFANGDLQDRAGFGLGRCYLEGVGTAIDPLKAIRYFAISLSEHDAYEIGGIYFDRAKDMLDKQTYVDWLKSNCDEIPYCNFKIGQMYEEGDYFPENKEMAISFYLKAARKGCVDGKMRAAILMSDSEDKSEQAESEKIFKEILSSKYVYEHKRAKRCLGVLYMETKREDAAIELFKELYQTNNDDVACSMIGVIYGEKKEYEEARRWYQLAYDISAKDKYKEMLDSIDEVIRTGADGSSKSSGGCYVATAVYGSYDCPQVWTLRRYRDNTLDSTWYGRLFIKLYYAVSPTIVKYFGGTKIFKRIFKKRLDKMVDRLNGEGVANTPYDDKKY